MLAAEASNQAKSVFLAAMSHEIRTPLNGVLGMAQVLKDSALTSENQEMAATIVDSGNVLLSVLNDILDISKIEAGQLDIERTTFDIPALVQAAADVFQLKAQEKNLTFDLRIAETAQRSAIGDPTRLRQVISNLLSNAVKFTSAGHVSLSVTLNRRMLRVRVEDTGIGIPEDRMADLFQPFQQLDASVNRRFGGTGLGLSISRNICQLMEGDITVSSKLGAGSVFEAHVQVTPTATPKPAPATENGDQIDPILNRKPWRILLAEDNRTNQFVFKKLVKDYSWDLTFAQDGQEAVQAYEAGTFDLMLMDINMPNVDGVEATQRIRAFEAASARAPTHIIALTANSMLHQVESYLAAGMDGHLAKPLKKDTLLSTIAKALPS